ncbi:IPT/TIG domain-containing protein [Rhizobium sp. XQZ8]|uniref:IPT/TIG domain-containing protein n=1 Tax=Rhizobium populisoli TaxID=2859785 RepID=UPI001CA565BD|nr:IPT/TIG domain-containing protein [Rhizobium populisoli]MBW6422647.1 IPT/TIG domain-containing protein [Rhizobium populisoli]
MSEDTLEVTKASDDYWIGVALFVFSLIAALLLVLAWPVPIKDNLTEVTTGLGNGNAQVRFLVLAMVAGAFGSLIASARNYAAFRGTNRYAASWNWWYLMSPVVGMGLGALLFVILQTGLFSISLPNNGSPQNANPAGFVAIAMLGGMFSRQAVGKLGDAFNTFLTPQEKPAATASQPVIDKIDPAEKNIGDGNLEIVINGKNFDSNPTVKVGGNERKIASKTNVKLTVTLDAADLAKAASLPVIVSNSNQSSSKPVNLVVK